MKSKFVALVVACQSLSSFATPLTPQLHVNCDVSKDSTTKLYVKKNQSVVVTASTNPTTGFHWESNEHVSEKVTFDPGNGAPGSGTASYRYVITGSDILKHKNWFGFSKFTFTLKGPGQFSESAAKCKIRIREKK